MTNWLRISGLPEAHLTALRFRYAEPWRHYHVWAHVEAMFAELARVEARMADPRAVAAAVLYHDAIYDPRSPRNERRSAELLAAECENILPPESLAAAVDMVLATETHAMPEGPAGPRAADMACLLDADLAILGAAPDAFDAYDAAIGREYAHVPQADFRRGRAAVLQGFLDRPAIYLSAEFREIFEDRARDNLRRALHGPG
ncbi:MAG: hypothetical protein ACLFWF_10490 [Alphaproteobacteria bacterium]